MITCHRFFFWFFLFCIAFFYLLILIITVRVAGESGVGKTSIMKHMLRRLEMPGGANLANSGSVVGCIMNYTDKNQALLQSIAMLSGYDHHSEGLCRCIVYPNAIDASTLESGTKQSLFITVVRDALRVFACICVMMKYLFMRIFQLTASPIQ